MNDLSWLITCTIIAALLPYFAKAPLAYAMFKTGSKHKPGYDNEEPRSQQRELTGFGARCLAAHENSFEALLIFATAVMLTFATDNVTRHAALLASIFVVCRILYLICYWVNWDKLRSTVWAVGIISCFIMMFNTLP
jgi:uncharacterized MAPEG superfamily protein